MICGHLTTLLSHRNWRVRATLYDSLLTVASYIGIESEIFIQPLLNQVCHEKNSMKYIFVLRCLGIE